MKYKRVICALVALLMVGANMAGPIRVFANEVAEVSDEPVATEEPAEEEPVVEEQPTVEEPIIDEEEVVEEEEVKDEEEVESSDNVVLNNSQSIETAPALLSSPVLLNTANTTVTTFAELDSAICEGGNIVIGADFTFDGVLTCYVFEDTTIDFNGHTITSTNVYGSNIWVYGATLTLTDSVGGGGYTDSASDTIAIAVENGEVVLNSGTITGTGWGIVAWGGGIVTVNGGEIVADGVGISGNGSEDNGGSEFYINGGKITAGELGIYAPQIDGVVSITAGTITGGETGVEIRSGELTISGGTITSNATTYSVSPNGSGSTTVGAAVAVAQHTTKQPITVNISGGTLTGVVPISEANPQGNSEDDIDKVSVSVTGGVFVTTGDESEHSDDKTKFITGGTFSEAPNVEAIADGYDAYELSNGYWVIDVKANVNLPTEPVFLSIGETYDLSDAFDATAKKYGTTGLADQGVVSEDEYVLTAEGAGNTLFNFQLHNLINPVDENVGVIVYTVEPDPADEMENDTDRENVAKFTLDEIKKMLKDDLGHTNSVWFSYGNADNLKSILSDYSTLITSLQIGLYDESEWDYIEAADEVMAEIKSNETIATIYYAFIEIYGGEADGWPYGGVYELDSPITMRLEIPEEYREAPAGYTRVFSIIRGHLATDDSETATRITPTRDGNDLVFQNDKFSSFAIVYEDVENEDEYELVNTPETGVLKRVKNGGDAQSENIVGLVALLGGTIIALGALAFSKRN